MPETDGPNKTTKPIKKKEQYDGYCSSDIEPLAKRRQGFDKKPQATEEGSRDKVRFQQEKTLVEDENAGSDDSSADGGEHGDASTGDEHDNTLDDSRDFHTSPEQDELLARKRKMNIIYSRRKREKKKRQVESLRNRGSELQQDNDRLRSEGQRLERLLEQATTIVTQIETIPLMTTGLQGSSSPLSITSLQQLNSVIQGNAELSQLCANRLPNNASRLLDLVSAPTTRGVEASDPLGILSQLRLNPLYAPQAGTPHWPNLSAICGPASAPSSGLPCGSSSQLSDNLLAQHLLLQHDQRRALIELTLQQEAANREVLLRQELLARAQAIEGGLPSQSAPFTLGSPSFPLSRTLQSPNIPGLALPPPLNSVPSMQQQDQATNLWIARLLEERQRQSGSSASNGNNDAKPPPRHLR